jgi:K+/H+ antiporter YhaU regulatory subunit KhtT
VILASVFVLLVEFTYFSTILMMGTAVILCIVIGYALLCVVFWKKVKTMALEGQNTLQMVLAREELPDDEPAVQSEPGTYKTITLPYNSGAVKLTLAQLHLRHRTGATIVKIDRGGLGELSNPDANARLAAGDRLYLVATDEQFLKASELLSSPRIEAGRIETLAEFLELRIENVRLKQGDFAPGKTLKELRLRNVSGTTVVRIRRCEGAMEDNPGPDVRLSIGDCVYVLGTASQIAQARAYLEKGADAGA